MGKGRKNKPMNNGPPPRQAGQPEDVWKRSQEEEKLVMTDAWQKRSQEVKRLGLVDDNYNPPPGQPWDRETGRQELRDAIGWAYDLVLADKEHNIFGGWDADNIGRGVRYHHQWLQDNRAATTGELRDHRCELLQCVNPICRKVYEATKAAATAQTIATGHSHSTVEVGEAESDLDLSGWFTFPPRAIEWVVQSARELPLKKALHDTCGIVCRFLRDDQCRQFFQGDDEDQLQMAVQAVDRWWNAVDQGWIFGQDAGNDAFDEAKLLAFEAKLLELHCVVEPIMSRVRLSGGGVGWLFAPPRL